MNTRLETQKSLEIFLSAVSSQKFLWNDTFGTGARSVFRR